jgi:hypothetical protein
MARAKKSSDCPPCPKCEGGATRRESDGPPDVRVIRGDLAVRSAREKAGAALSSKKGQFQYDQFGYYRKSKKKPCGYVPGKTPPLGHMELEMVSNRDAESMGIPAGPALRLCIRQSEPGPIVHVRDPEEAKRIGDAYKACLTGEGKDKESCAVGVLKKARPGQDIHLAGVRKKTTRKARR